MKRITDPRVDEAAAKPVRSRRLGRRRPGPDDTLQPVPLVDAVAEPRPTTNGDATMVLPHVANRFPSSSTAPTARDGAPAKSAPLPPHTRGEIAAPKPPPPAAPKPDVSFTAPAMQSAPPMRLPAPQPGARQNGAAVEAPATPAKKSRSRGAKARAKAKSQPAATPPPAPATTPQPLAVAMPQPALVARARPAPAPIVEAPTDLEPPRARGIVGPFVARVAAIVILILCGLNIFWLRWENLNYYWYRPLLNAYSIGVAGFILSRFVVALFYRPPRDVGLTPSVSVIITAFNEEEAIYRTVECSYAVDYPREKLQVIAVDDGSSDGTIPELEKARKIWPDLRIVAFEQNRGKREAMAAGARVATGDILVYVDSDSFLRRDAMRKIVQGFANPEVAAVAGHTEVANTNTNGLTRMQQVRYYVAFRVMKAAESVFGAVTCCPGCFSAYRRDTVLEVLEPWLNQRFLGVQATFGDDRSLTNFLLRRFQVIYASDAVATTIVPDQHRKFLKQQVRWKKSWLRECLIACGFMWKKHPFAAVSFYAQTLFPIIAPLIMIRVFFWLPIVEQDLLSMLVFGFGVTLIGLIFSAYYLFWKADGAWLSGVSFTLYYMFVLIWQMPYAILTSRDNRWGTR